MKVLFEAGDDIVVIATCKHCHMCLLLEENEVKRLTPECDMNPTEEFTCCACKKSQAVPTYNREQVFFRVHRAMAFLAWSHFVQHNKEDKTNKKEVV
jgi:hypothetical protein